MSESITEKSSIEAKGAADGLSTALPTLYSSIIQRIPPKELDTFTNVLHWVTLAARPLSVNELTAAVTISAPGYADEWLLSRKHIKLCEPLVVVQHDEVFLVHPSLEDYLLRRQEEDEVVVERVRESFAAAHLSLAKSCLDALGNKSPLSDYAKLNWSYHVKQCPEQVQVTLIRKHSFFKQGSAVRFYWWKSDRKRSKKAGIDDGPPLDFQMACYLGLRIWAQMILDKQSPMRYLRLQSIPLGRSFKTKSRMAGKPPRKQTCLRSLLTTCFSSQNQQEPTKDQTAKAKRCKLPQETNALYYAALGGSGPEIVSFLLANGSDPNARGPRQESPLSVAASWPQLDVMRLLLNHGANPNGSLSSTDRVQMTPLCHAVRSGILEAVTLLLDSGSSIKVGDRCMARSIGLTLLQSAASKGSKALVEILLDRGADPLAVHNGKPVPLCIAIEGGHNKVVNFLLDRTTAYAEVENPCTSWPLYTALSCRRRKIAKKIIRCGDDPDMSSITALNLWSAIVNGKLADVHGKLKRGADPNIATPVSQGCPSGLTSLHWAVIEWQHRRYNAITSQDFGTIVRELLEHDADAGLTDARGKTALQYAYEEGEVWKAVRKLLARSRETLYNCDLDLLRTGGTRGHTC